MPTGHACIFRQPRVSKFNLTVKQATLLKMACSVLGKYEDLPTRPLRQHPPPARRRYLRLLLHRNH